MSPAPDALADLVRGRLSEGRSIDRGLLDDWCSWDTDPRDVLRILVDAGIPESKAEKTVGAWAWLSVEPEFLRPWAAEDPGALLEPLADYTTATSALRTLALLPEIPEVLLPAIARIAVGRSERNRPLAQGLLAALPLAAELAGRALADTNPSVRRIGAAWLADLGVNDAVERLRAARARETDPRVRGDILRALRSCGDDVADLVAAEALAAPARRSARPPAALTWFPFESLPVVHPAAGGAALAPGTVSAWVRLAHDLKDPDGRGSIACYLALLEPRDAAALSAVVVESWVAHNRENGKTTSLRTKGLLAFAVGVEGGRLAALARSALRRSATWRAESEAVLRAVAANGSPAALQLVVSAASDHRLPRVRDFARSLARAAADERGWSAAELGDRTIPDAGFAADGLLHLSYGDREFLGRPGPDLAIVLTDADGGPRAGLPPARRGEDADLVAAARRRLADARREARAVAAAQTRRLYEAMCASRSWPAAVWRDVWIAHPLARRLAGRLVWTAREADGARGAPGRPRTFRPAEDGALLGPDDARLDLPDGAVVRLAHGTLVDGAEAAAWREHLADYEVVPLFDQFSAPAPPAVTGRALDDLAGRRVIARDLRRSAASRGYERSPGIYRYREFHKDFPELGLRAVLTFGGADAREEIESTTTGGLLIRRGRRELDLAGVPPVLLAECCADYRAVVAAAGPAPGEP